MIIPGRGFDGPKTSWKLGASSWKLPSGLLRSLHCAHAGNAAQAQDHAIQVAQVFGLNHKLDNRFAFFVAPQLHAANIGVSSEITAVSSFNMPVRSSQKTVIFTGYRCVLPALRRPRATTPH